MRELTVLAFADLHSPDSFVLPEYGSIGFDVVVTLGDIPLGLIERILHYAGNRPCLGIAGNHDPQEIPGILNLHRQTVVVQGVKFGGFGGAPRYKRAPNHYTEFQVARGMILMPKVDVFLSHAPPRVTSCNEGRLHRGFRAFDLYLKRQNPGWWFHGHLSQQSTCSVGQTTVCGVHEQRLMRIRIPD